MARLLNVILITVMALVMVFSIPALVMTPEIGRIFIEIVLALWSLLIWILLRRGHVYAAGFLLSLTLWLVVSYGTYEAGGFRGSIMSAYFGIILIAELLLGIRAGIIFGTLSIAMTGWMLYADSQGLLPPPPEYATILTFWEEFSAVVIGVVLLLSLVMNSLQQALNRARRNERELALKVQEIRILAQRATEANEFKSRLIAQISHELRTPLGAVLGMSEMLQQHVYGELTPAQYDIAQRIINNANALEQVFTELLDQSQIESGQLRLKKEMFAPQALAQAVRENYLPQAQQKGLLLDVTIGHDCPERVRGDKGKIGQVLSNLVINAIKFTEAGCVTIHIDSHDETNWVLQVKDTGIGITGEAQTYIFDPFRQVDESMGRKFGGVGLGLSIVQQLVIAMNGTVQVTSEVGHGSTFTVVLPLG